MSKLAYIFVHISTKEPNTLEWQLEECQMLAEDRGYRVVDELIIADDEHVSCSSLLQALADKMLPGSTLLVQNIDRLYQEENIFDILHAKDCKVCTTSEGEYICSDRGENFALLYQRAQELKLLSKRELSLSFNVANCGKSIANGGYSRAEMNLFAISIGIEPRIYALKKELIAELMRQCKKSKPVASPAVVASASPAVASSPLINGEIFALEKCSKIPSKGGYSRESLNQLALTLQLSPKDYSQKEALAIAISNRLKQADNTTCLATVKATGLRCLKPARYNGFCGIHKLK